MLLKEAIAFTNSEGGTIYLKENDALYFKTIVNQKLEIDINNPDFPCVPLYHDSLPNSENISAICALKKERVNIPDVYLYNMDGLSFEGVKKFDKANDYRTSSMLVIPMINQDDEVVGVVQLINKKSEACYIQFEQKDIEMTSTYANWAAIAITKNRLTDDLEALFFSFLESISVAMSAKSPFGNDHVARVAALMKSVSTQIDEDQGMFKNINYSQEALKELEVAAWMHDIGKIATPDYLLDKATKLEMVYDRIAEIKTRFDYVKSLLKVQMLEEKIVLLQKRNKSKIEDIEENFALEILALENDFELLNHINAQEKMLSEEDIQSVKDIASKSYHDKGETMMMLSESEVENLTIKSGTFTHKERLKVNEHAKTSQDMMQMLTFPKKLSRVQEIACAHHEKLNGKGHPLGLHADEISFEGRLMAIVDIFEALTAHDRAYKKPKTVNETFKILDRMAQNGELDVDILHFLKATKAYEPYAQKYLLKEQYTPTQESIL
jgi:HD-GYP domain-containing protein (c-di-GMP phosphodiesterase class II)